MVENLFDPGEEFFFVGIVEGVIFYFLEYPHASFTCHKVSYVLGLLLKL